MKNWPIQFRAILCLLLAGAMTSRSTAQDSKFALPTLPDQPNQPSIAVQQSAPATQPGTRATDAQINEWLNQLADVDPDIRESGVQSLMGLTRDDLPRLRALAKAQAPLMPGQSAALQDVVKQVYLSGGSEPVLKNRGFLGLQWGPVASQQFHAGGLPVIERLEGFPAYRLLREGDLITEVVNRPEIDVHDVQAFCESVRTLNAGNILLLRIQRGGQSLVVPVALVPRPAALPDDANPTEWQADRLADESDYWSKNFVNLETSSTFPSTQP